MAVIAKNWTELKKPNKLEARPSADHRRKGSFVAEPLERGFGLTLGNALRRVLLSSLQGAAVTAIKMDGVLHEFSSLAGVREDVTDIVLNIKQIAIRMQGDQAKRIMLTATGPGEVTAGQITVSGDMEIMNPELMICTLDEGATLNMELTVEAGKGYVPASMNRPADAPIGLVPVDALYSPVRQVSYKVENTRVGQELDYDKLTISVETDGTLTPEDALAYAAQDPAGPAGAVRQFRGAGAGLHAPVSTAAACRSARSRSTTPRRSTATCSRRSTSSNCRCARRTA